MVAPLLHDVELAGLRVPCVRDAVADTRRVALALRGCVLVQLVGPEAPHTGLCLELWTGIHAG